MRGFVRGSQQKRWDHRQCSRLLAERVWLSQVLQLHECLEMKDALRHDLLNLCEDLRRVTRGRGGQTLREQLLQGYVTGSSQIRNKPQNFCGCLRWRMAWADAMVCQARDASRHSFCIQKFWRAWCYACKQLPMKENPIHTIYIYILMVTVQGTRMPREREKAQAPWGLRQQ